MVSKPFQRPFSLATRLTFFISLATIAAFFGYGVTRKLADIRRTGGVIHRFTVAICQGDQHIGITTDDIFQRH